MKYALVATGCIFKQKGQIAEPILSITLSDLFDASEKDGLFATETNAIRALHGIVVTNDMLAGW